MAISTWEATPNIAVVKYWGKRDDWLNLPENGSISVTMDRSLRSVTSVEFKDSLSADSLVLNGRKASQPELARAKKVLDAVRMTAGVKCPARVASENNFPTAAGIASSASGFAALACAASDAAGLGMPWRMTGGSAADCGEERRRGKVGSRELSLFARLGSGSACRSVLGGFAEWRKGARKDGLDSYAVQVAPASHWPKIRNVIAIVDEGRKKIGSAEGMEITTKTSKLYPRRVMGIPKVISAMRQAILARDLETFLLLTMRESSHMHAVMLDSYPPITYLNDVSREIMGQVHEFNLRKGGICAGYTFDAGPNAHVYTEERHAGEAERMLRGIGGVQKTMVCKAGEGPKKLAENESLI